MPVCVRLHARRFRCVNATCSRQTFRERLPDLAPRYQRRTPALRRQLEAVSFALGGQAGRRLAHRLHLGPGEQSQKPPNPQSAGEPAPRAPISPPLRVLGVANIAPPRWASPLGAPGGPLKQPNPDPPPGPKTADPAGRLKTAAPATFPEGVGPRRRGAVSESPPPGAPQRSAWRAPLTW